MNSFVSIKRRRTFTKVAAAITIKNKEVNSKMTTLTQKLESISKAVVLGTFALNLLFSVSLS